MSISFISTQDYSPQEYIEFSIEAAKDTKNKDLVAIYNSFTLLANLTYGKIFKQRDSGELWHVSPGNTIARRITEERLRFFLKWDTCSLLPDNLLFNKLKAIGGLPAHEFSLSPNYIQFPCKVRTVKGETRDLCLLHFSASPPYQTYFKNLLLLDEIVDIEPSELALPHDLRMESMLVDEIRMGFYPFMVKTRAGELLTYNGTTAFVSKGDVKGSEIERQVPFSFDAKYKFVDIPYDDITYVIGKWDTRFEELFVDYRGRLKNKESANSNVTEKGDDGYKPNGNFLSKLGNWLRGK